MTIAESIQRLSVKESYHSHLCTVISYDPGEMTCEVLPVDGSANFIEVRINAVNGNTGFVPIPAVGSKVLVSRSAEDVSFISMFSEVDSLLISTSGAITISGTSIQFNGGLLGGLININDLVSKINGIENKLNDLIAASKIHTHAANGTPSTNFATITSLTNTVVDDIEDPSVIH